MASSHGLLGTRPASAQGPHSHLMVPPRWVRWSQMIQDDPPLGTSEALPAGSHGGQRAGLAPPEWGDLGAHPHPHPHPALPGSAAPLPTAQLVTLSVSSVPHGGALPPRPRLRPWRHGDIEIPAVLNPPPLSPRCLPLLLRDLSCSAGSSAARGASWHRLQLFLNYRDNFNSQ